LAVPETNYEFDYWEVKDTKAVYSRNKAETLVVGNKDISLIAVFKPKQN